MNNIKYLCQLCNKEQKNIYGFLSHLRWHHPGITTKIYYDKYFKKKGEGICQTPGCGNICNFYNLSKGYNKHCSRECILNHLNESGMMKKAKIDKNGFYNNNRSKAKQTCLDKYGVTNVSKVKAFHEMKKQTSLKNNVYECWVGSKQHINWMKDGGAAYCNQFITNPSKPQVALFKLCQETLPYPIMNYPSCGYSIDIVIPSLNLAIEYDGSYWHQDEEYDNKRQTAIEEDGWMFLRYRDYVPDKNELMKHIGELI